MNERILEHYLDELSAGIDIDPAEAETLFDALITSKKESLLAETLSAWNDKGVSEDELFAFASIMRARMKTIESGRSEVVDIVGTGGSHAKTFNVSTAAAFTIAGAGAAVAKHGNRAATSNSGSADVLSLLGVDIDIDPSAAESHLHQHGICFMFAPRYHSLSPTLAAARRSLCRPTIFNNLGPLCNPASAAHQVIGVWDLGVMEKTAAALSRLGTTRSWIVHGENGLDEIALKGKTYVCEIEDGKIDRFEITAADFGVYTLGSDLPSRCTAEESAETVRKVLSGGLKERDAERLVLINAAAAIFVAGRAKTLADAYAMAEDSIRSGAAWAKLALLAGKTK